MMWATVAVTPPTSLCSRGSRWSCQGDLGLTTFLVVTRVGMSHRESWSSIEEGQLTFDTKIPEPKKRSLERLEVNCAKRKVSHESPLASEMKIDTLYLPDDTSYPFVDMLWVEKDAPAEDTGATNGGRTIFAAQNSTSSSHEKELAVYESLRERLKMTPAQLLVVYMAVLPKHVDGYLNGPVSTYFKGTTKRGRAGNVFEFPSNVEFRVLLPDKEMRNRSPNEADYQKALDNIYKEPTRSSPRTQPA